jgi:hypothetical protein
LAQDKLRAAVESADEQHDAPKGPPENEGAQLAVARVLVTAGASSPRSVAPRRRGKRHEQPRARPAAG